MPLPKRRSPPRRKDRRERSRSRSFSPYSRRETHHHADDYHAYSRPSHSRSTSGHQGYHRSRTPVGHMTSVSTSSSTQPPTRRHRYSPSIRHEVRSSREHSQRSFSPQPRHSSLSSKQRSRSPMWSASRQVVPPVGSMEFAHLDTSFKKSTQTFNQSGRRSPPSSYCENPSTSSYSARKMSPSFQRFTSETYLPSGTPVPEDNYSRVALGRTYLQNSARCSLSERFKMFDPVESFHYDEKITIGIHCGIQGPPGSPRPVRHEFNPYNFIMVRQKNEGSRPIFDREELRQYCYDETEEDPDDYRVVTVAPTDRDDYMQVGATDSSYNVGYRSPPRPGGPPSYQWNEDQYGYNRHPREGFEDSRSFLGQSDNRERWMSESRMRPVGSPSHRYGGSESIYPPDRGEPRDWERLERVQHNPDDLRHSIGARFSGSTRKKSGFQEGSYYDREYEAKGRESKYSKNSPEILPDFSKRPDKYQYEEWREHPEMVPRGSNYYEHDTRPDVDVMPNRSRSVGRFRSRGGILRRPFRPFRSRGTFKPRLTTHSSSARRPFGSRSLGRFRSRPRGHIGLRSRARGRGGGSSDLSGSADDWKETSYSKSEKQAISDK